MTGSPSNCGSRFETLRLDSEGAPRTPPPDWTFHRLIPYILQQDAGARPVRLSGPPPWGKLQRSRCGATPVTRR